MFEIKVTVEIPDLVKAAQMLAGLKGYPGAVPPYTAPAVPLPDPTPVIPVATMPAEQQAVATTTTAPTAAPAFTLAQVSKAGAELLTSKPALLPQLQELLQKYGASTAQELPLDRLGEFAAELRAMGGKI